MGDPGKVNVGQDVVRPVFDSYGRLFGLRLLRAVVVEPVNAGAGEDRDPARGQPGHDRPPRRARGEELADGLSAWRKSVCRPGFGFTRKPASTRPAGSRTGVQLRR